MDLLIPKTSGIDLQPDLSAVENKPTLYKEKHIYPQGNNFLPAEFPQP